METIKVNYVSVTISKYQLYFTKAENEDRYLTNLTDDMTY